jgi:hypothetical protein
MLDNHCTFRPDTSATKSKNQRLISKIEEVNPEANNNKNNSNNEK